MRKKLKTISKHNEKFVSLLILYSNKINIIINIDTEIYELLFGL